MTSGNLSDEPIAHDDDDAVRPARARWSTASSPTTGRSTSAATTPWCAPRRRRVQLLRRSRGMAPRAVAAALGSPPVPVLAVGAELKSTVAVATGETVVASHHIGDLEHLATYQSFLQALDHLCRLYGVEPEVVAHDLHPEYLSTKLADRPRPPDRRRCSTTTPTSPRAWSSTVATEPVLGLAFDGLGYGADGTLWGGEVLVADLDGYERVGHLRPCHARRGGRHPRAVAHGGGVGGGGRVRRPSRVAGRRRQRARRRARPRRAPRRDR